MKLMLHISSAPASVACIKKLRSEGIEPVGYWYNPNIHPFTEYKMRRDSVIAYAEKIGLELIVEDEYNLRPFIQAVARDIDHRCGYCHAVRMGKCIQYAARHGFDAVATTLTAEPGQDAAVILSTGKELAEALEFRFEPYDFSALCEESRQEAEQLGLYLHQYKGCIFSEEDHWRELDQLPKPGKICF